MGVDPRRGDQIVRGAAVLPHGTGRAVRVCVFAGVDQAEAAKAAGADRVGSQDLVDAILRDGPKAIDFDAVVATPDQMPMLSKAGRVLGPRGLMPNPKTGTVTQDPAGAVAQLKQGRAEFRVDKHGHIHGGVGPAASDPAKLEDNVCAFVSAVADAKPPGAKGTPLSPLYIRQCYVATTFGRGYNVALPSLFDAVKRFRAQ